MGVNTIKVLAIPILVFWIANRENVTTRKGSVNEPAAIYLDDSLLTRIPLRIKYNRIVTQQPS